jgi:hypothetical protein
MKIIINILALSLSIYSLSAQNFKTDYTKSYISKNCGEEKFAFTFYNNTLFRTDSYYNTSIKVPSKRQLTDFDNSGFYYEMWSPTFYLELYGINEYNKVPQFNYKVCFDKKGGDLLYIFESEANSGIDSGKFYFTEKGRNIFCTD